MKRLKDQIVLTGQLERISISAFRRLPGEVFTQCEMGKVFIITMAGKEAFVLSRVPGVELGKRVNRDGSQELVL